MIIILVLSLFFQIGCTGVGEVSVDKGKVIMEEYETIISSDITLSEYIDFISKNISELSSDNASKLIIKLEEMQKSNLETLEGKYLTTDNIQSKLDETFGPNYDLSNIDIDNIKDEEVKKIIEETKSLGYKVEVTEGMFFPIIDYGFYKKYSDYVSIDIKDYINIMAVESDKIPAKDAGLIISWNEVVDRVFNQEEFIVTHKDSIKIDDMKKLYDQYVYIVLYGMDNTPLFDYHSKTMNADVKAAYKNAITRQSKLSEILKEYYEILEKDDFKLTDKGKDYRDDIVNNMKYIP